MHELKDAIGRVDPIDHFVAVDGADNDLDALPDHFVLSKCINVTQPALVNCLTDQGLIRTRGNRSKAAQSLLDQLGFEVVPRDVTLAGVSGGPIVWWRMGTDKVWTSVFEAVDTFTVRGQSLQCVVVIEQPL